MKIRCNEIVTPAGVIDGLVIVEDGKIAQLVPADELKEEAWDEDWRGYKLLPGLIDIHTHGYYGYSALSTKPEDFHALSKQMAAVGVTSYLVTAGDHNETEMENLGGDRAGDRRTKAGLKRGSADARHSHGRTVPQSKPARCISAGRAAWALR